MKSYSENESNCIENRDLQSDFHKLQTDTTATF